jgi:capsular polysaccharide biosynthesis protein
MIASAFLDGLPVLLPAALQLLPFLQQTLALFPKTQVRWVERGRAATVAELLSISTMASGYQFNPTLMKLLRSRLLSADGVPTGAFRCRRLYVSRARCKYRKILNDGELLRILSDFGFEPVFFEDDTRKEQMVMCEHTDILLGPHGAEFSNMLFMHAGAAIVKLQRRNSWPTSYSRFTLSLQ